MLQTVRQAAPMFEMAGFGTARAGCQTRKDGGKARECGMPSARETLFKLVPVDDLQCGCVSVTVETLRV
jgi:hypothetical protein